MAESAITIIAASIPILRALLRDDKMSNAPQSEDEIELNTGNWNMSSLSNTNLGNNLNVDNVNGSNNASSNNNSSTSTFGSIRAAVTRAKKSSKPTATAAPRNASTTTTTTTTSSTRGAPSWVTRPVTISSANRDRTEDSRPLSTEIATGSKSLV